jgi:hypothetical protein
MSHAMLLPPGAWQADGALAQARFVAPGAGRLCVWAEGADGQAVLHRADGAAIGFDVLGGSAFAGCEVAAREPLRITAQVAPRRCLVLLRGADVATASLCGAFPRAVIAPPRRATEDTATSRAAMEAALAAQDLDGALAALADLLVVAREDAATQQAAAALLRHLAAHPMLRGAALGALAAALTEVPA